jgi:hypothetical protein
VNRDSSVNIGMAGLKTVSAKLKESQLECWKKIYSLFICYAPGEIPSKRPWKKLNVRWKNVPQMKCPSEEIIKMIQ